MFLQPPSTVNFPKSQVPLHHNPKCPSFPSHQKTILPKKNRLLPSVLRLPSKTQNRLLPSTVVRAKPKKSRVASLGLETLSQKMANLFNSTHECLGQKNH